MGSERGSTGGAKFAESGFVIIGDIVGFSERVNDVQRALVRKLWLFLNSRPELAPESGNDAILNGTGDGALIAFPRISKEDINEGNVFRWADAVAFATAWIEHMQKGQKDGGNDPSASLRIGIHQGPFQIIDVRVLGGIAEHGGKQVVGLAPNVCARVAGLGDAGDIIFSDDFVQSWSQQEEVEPDAFDPRLETPPFAAFVKHGRQLLIRRRRTTAPVPKRLADGAVVTERIVETLEHIEMHLRELLGDARIQLSRELLSARISIWVPDRKRAFLEQSEYRWHFRKEATERSKTRYPISDGGAGPLGRAFADRSPFTLTKLPDCADGKNPAKLQTYCNKLTKETGLAAEVARGFSRFARSYLAFPFGLRTDYVDGVVCIDCKASLAGLPKQRCKEIVRIVQSVHGVKLAALWSLRRA